MTQEQRSFLSRLSTEQLTALINETLSKDIAMSAQYFAIGMSTTFHRVKPIELFDMITTILRERFQ